VDVPLQEPSMSEQVYGTILVVGAAVTHALVAYIVKKDVLPISVAVECRFFVCWLMSVGFVLRYRSQYNLTWFGSADMRNGLIVRAILVITFVVVWWSSLNKAPLGDCVAVVYCFPVITVVLSRVFLGEEALAVFPFQVLMAISGVCFIMQPPLILHALGLDNSKQSSDYTLHVIAMLIAGTIPVVTRHTREANWIEVEHVTNCLSAFIFSPIFMTCQFLANGEAAVVVPSLGAQDMFLIVLVALGTFAGVAMQTQGYQMAEPGKAVMFTYLEIPFAYLLQMESKSSIPSHSIFGAVLIFAACFLGALEKWWRKPHDIALRQQSADSGSQASEICSPESNGPSRQVSYDLAAARRLSAVCH